MLSNRVTFAALAAACIAAAGAGGYLASRQNAVPTPAAAMAASTPPAAATTTPDHPVQETEVVLGGAAKAPAAPERPAAPTIKAATNSPTSRRAGAAPSVATLSGRSAKLNAQQDPPGLDRTWPTSALPTPGSQAPGSPAPATPAPDNGTATARGDDRAQEQPRTEQARTPEPPPPQKTFEEVVVSANSVIGLQTESRISSDTARIEDRVDARVTRDVKVGDQIAIPAGSRVIGSVTQVVAGGKFKERARLGIRFNTLVLADGTRLPMSTDTIVRDGESPSNSAAAKVGGGTIGGAILGALLGGAKGAAIGATAGAAGGAGVTEAGARSTVTLPAGSPMTVRLLTPVTVTLQQK